MIGSQSYCFLGIITIYFFFCLLPSPNTFASPRQSLCRPDQRDALLELKKEFPIHTNGDRSVTTTPWNKSVDCCFWEGVKCDDTNGEVISINLVSYIASTSFKPSSGLFKLQNLHSLVLSNCHLQGEIPSSFGNLYHLTHLDLSNNQLVGEVPASIGKLNQLRYMDLSSNDLIGNIPTSFVNLTKLSELRLNRNQFTGGADTVLANLTSLTYIDLSFNHFQSSISAYLSGLHNLKRFYVIDNLFVGPFPSSLLMISSLVEIDLSRNKFTGPIDFENTSSYSQLAVLDIGYNNFDGLIPQSIPKLRNLQSLDLSHNNFVGRVPRSISKLVNLSSLDLSYNKLKGQVPHFLWRSSELIAVMLSHNIFTSFGKPVEVINGASIIGLDLGSNLLQGPIPQWICKLRNLEALDLSNNHFTGSVPQCLKSSASELNLRNNSLSGFIPDLCSNGTSLRSFDVSHNNLVGKLPKSLLNCTDMEILNVGENKIKDNFPFWLGSLPRLMVLVLRSNAFCGPVYNPSEYLGFPHLRIIDISNNKFVGSLPHDYFASWTEMSLVWRSNGNLDMDYIGFDNGFDSIDLTYKINRILQGFKAIDFSGNRFCGHIPESIGLLSELQILNLSGNTFTDNIPSSLANILNLESLDLSRNNLSGEIPQGFRNLSSLAWINISYNHIKGVVPQTTQFQRQRCSSFVGNPELYGLEEICGGSHHVPVPTTQQPEESLSKQEKQGLIWIAAAIAFGHIFTSYKHEWFISR